MNKKEWEELEKEQWLWNKLCDHKEWLLDQIGGGSPKNFTDGLIRAYGNFNSIMIDMEKFNSNE